MLRTMLTFISLTSLALAGDFADTLFKDQWGLVNNGQKVLITTGKHDKVEVEGVPGADINWVTPKEMQEKYQIPADREIIVAVIDSGMDVNHPDLKDRVWFNKEACKDDDRKGYCYGYNALDSYLNEETKKMILDPDISDDMGHGTHIAGIIAANANSFGVVGVTHNNVKIMPVKVMKEDVKSFIYIKPDPKKTQRLISDIFADGIRFAVNNGANVINMSFGWPKVVQTPKLDAALDIAEKRNIPVIVAAGNNNKDFPVYPCSSSGVICVGATTNTGKISEFTNFGGKVDILAPGHAIISTYPTANCKIVRDRSSDNSPCLKQGLESRILRLHGYESIKGSSQAAPFVAAIAASLKLMNPEMDIDELKARLFNSARTTNDSDDEGKFSKYGLIDMKKALEEKPELFLSVDFKNQTEINYSQHTKSFAFNMPIKNFVGTAKEVKVKISSYNPAIGFKESEFTYSNLGPGEMKNLIVEGMINDMSGDSHFILTVEITADEKFKSTIRTNLVVSRNLMSDRSLTKFVATDLDPKYLLKIRKEGKRSYLRQVSDIYKRNFGPEYFFINPEKQTETESVVSLMSITKDGLVQREINLPKFYKILTLSRVDTNMDGQPDYVAYIILDNKQDIAFVHLDKDLKPLFGDKSTWIFPIDTSFQGLPIKYSYQEDFQWVKRKSEALGDVLVPAVYKRWFMPDEDNSRDILERIPRIPRDHLYYLDPVVDAENNNRILMKIRAFDSFNFMKKMRRSLRLKRKISFKLEKPFIQSLEDVDQGKLVTLFSTGQEFQKKYYLVTIDSVDDWKYRPLAMDVPYVSGNEVWPMLDMENKNNPSSISLFKVLLDRQGERSYVLDYKNGSNSEIQIESKSWSDRFFEQNLLAAFLDVDRTFFLQSRYNVYVFDNKGKRDALPIYRESSFPGVNFSETMMPMVATSGDKKLPGVFADSTLIFGERLYSMIKTENGLVRPIWLSVNLPRQCVRLNPVRLGDEGDFYLAMLCTKGSHSVELQYMSLKLD